MRALWKPTKLTPLDLPSNGLYIIRADGTELTTLLVSDDFKGGPDWTTGG